ncbi:MAG: hypothetical protein HUJ25_07575 [Crocinitomicaceae bacterium]|nr:hypothetical protein [Crocinitomicaceae bacterium]
MERGVGLNGEDLLITPKHIHLITGMDLETAEREHAYLRKQLGFGSNDLLLSQYCELNDLDREEIISFLYPRKERNLKFIPNTTNEIERRNRDGSTFNNQ